MIATEGARNVIDLSQPHRPHRPHRPRKPHRPHQAFRRRRIRDRALTRTRRPGAVIDDANEGMVPCALAYRVR